MTHIARTVWLQLLGWLQRKCEHPPGLVVADILEGDGDCRVAWCGACGATRVTYSGQPACAWREPRADWFPARDYTRAQLVPGDQP